MIGDALPTRFAGHTLFARLDDRPDSEGFLALSSAVLSRQAPVIVVRRFRRELLQDDEALRRFEHTARLALFAKSPHVANLLEVGTAEDAPYIATEYVPGWSLDAVIARARADGRHIPIGVVVALVSNLLAGLRAVHEAETAQGPVLAVHRDLCPRNLLLGADGRLRILDFGIARSELASWETATGVVLGTRGYLAPERIRGRRSGQPADLYVAGSVAFELLTLLPYAGREGAAASSVRADTPRALDAWLAQALAEDPDDRFSTARSMNERLLEVADPAEVASAARFGRTLMRQASIDPALARLETVLGRDDDLPSRPPPPAEPMASPPRSIPRGQVVLAVLLAAAMVVLVATVRALSSSGDALPEPETAGQVTPSVRAPARQSAVAIEVPPEPEGTAVSEGPSDGEALRPRQSVARGARRSSRLGRARSATPAEDTRPLDLRIAADERQLTELRATRQDEATQGRLLRLQLELAQLRLVEDPERAARLLGALERAVSVIAAEDASRAPHPDVAR